MASYGRWAGEPWSLVEWNDVFRSGLNEMLMNAIEPSPADLTRARSGFYERGIWEVMLQIGALVLQFPRAEIQPRA